MIARPIRRARSLMLSLVFIFLFCISAGAQESAPEGAYRINYRLSMTQPASHLFEVQMSVKASILLDAVDFQMPAWSPGRYGVFDFAKNIQEFKIVESSPRTGMCQRLGAERIDIQTWRVYPCASSVTISYKVFADDLSGTFSQLDERHANFNGGSIFMYIVGHKPDPVTLKIEPPNNWRIVNGRMDRDDQREWQFPNYDILIDTPTEIAPNWTKDEFKVAGKTFYVVIHSLGDEGGKRAALVRDLEKIVRAEVGMWGAPEFDSYTFLLHFDPTAQSGDGMEHLTSTQIIKHHALGEKGTYEDTLDAAAHEFFHVWNVKRLRPIELGPWDFTRPLATRSLWIAEGITNYYGHLMQRRAGIRDDTDFYETLANEIGRIENAPGSRLMSAEEASLIAPFRDRAVSAQRTNLHETSISYYDKGEDVGLVLDLSIRGQTHGAKSLDDVMRRLYEEFYLKSPKMTYYLRGRGYTGADFQRVATEVAGADLSDFFARYVRGTEPLPYNEAFAQVGLRLIETPAKSDRADSPMKHFEYRIEEMPNASTEAKEMRRAWMKNR